MPQPVSVCDSSDTSSGEPVSDLSRIALPDHRSAQVASPRQTLEAINSGLASLAGLISSF
ncbi:hypothetical protein [Streptomyces sp. NRRL F-5053]|uniref:hypothetical protein n=1 Tax=Streptomyces sp. NRRL F-5053 TaxID=1463854 RepID=UPI0004CAEF21|nr:hypothetical protein [Streptomyces sp. NRRL F-5053]